RKPKNWIVEGCAPDWRRVLRTPWRGWICLLRAAGCVPGRSTVQGRPWSEVFGLASPHVGPVWLRRNHVVNPLGTGRHFAPDRWASGRIRIPRLAGFHISCIRLLGHEVAEALSAG